MANHRHLVQLLLLAVVRPADGAGPPPTGGTQDCPGTLWNDTLDSASWGGHLPGVSLTLLLTLFLTLALALTLTLTETLALTRT